MPWIEERRSLQPLTNYAPPDDEVFDPSTREVFGAAFRTQNTIASYRASRGGVDPYEIEDGFDSIQTAIDDVEMAPYVTEFAGVFNRKAWDAKKLQIKREEQDRRTVEAGGWLGVAGSMAAGVLDLPTFLIPGGIGLAAGRAAGSMAVGVATGAALDAGVSELALQATQTGRTGTESAINIGGSIVLGGALGALVGRYMTPEAAGSLSRKIDRQGAEWDEMDAAFSRGGSSVGAAQRDAGPLTLKDEAFIKKLPIINRQDPMIRLQLSELDTSRQVVRQLAETPLEYADNARGVATEKGGSVETRIKQWNAPLARSLREVDTLFARYFKQTPEPSGFQRALSPMLSEFDRMRGNSNRLTYKQFKEEVGKAAFSGEKHAIPEVAEAARIYRQLDDQMKKAAIEAKLLPEDVAVQGDVSHLFRMYNREKIIAERGQFAEILTDYLRTRRDAATFQSEEIGIANRIVESDRVSGRFNQAFRRLENVEERLAERQELRGRRVGDLDQLRQNRFDAMRERAPEGIVRALRGADETKVMVDTVRESRAAARSSGAKKPYAERYPVLSIIKGKGGVRVGSKLDGELRAMDITPKTHPGLFRRDGSVGDVDNFVKSEHDVFDLLPDDGNGYADPRSIMQAIRDETGGNPLRSQADLETDALAENLDQVASEWLEQVGLGPNATVKEVRDYIRRVTGAERNLGDLDTRISRLEGELDEFDVATDRLRNEREISAADAGKIAEELESLEAELAQVADLANASPRVKQIVDYARARRDLFKGKLQARTLKNRVETIADLQKAGRASDDMLAEMAAKSIDLTRVNARIDKAMDQANRLEPLVKSQREAEKIDEFANLSDAELRGLADETIDTILGNAEGRIPYDSIVSGPRGPLKERLLRIESAKIQDFMELDIERVMHAQVRTMSADVEMAKKFGSVDLAEQIRHVNDEANRKIANATTPEQRKALDKARKDAVRDIEGIRDRLRGQYALPSNPDSLVIRANRVVRNLNYVRLLGGMTISAIPDAGKVVFTHGLTSTFRDGFLPMIRSFKAYRGASEEVKLAGTALDMVLDSRVMAMADITDDFGRHSKFERGLQAVSTRFGIGSLMSPWNAAMKQFSGVVTMTNLLRGADDLAKGKASPAVIRKLAASGIDEELAQRISRQFGEHGDKTKGVWLAQTINWTDREAIEAVRSAIVRDVDRIIVTPGQDKPLWMSTELGKTLGQFKSFPISSTQKTLLAGLQQRDAATLNGTLLMMALGAFTYAIKEKAAGRDVSDDPAVWATNAFDRSGLTGWLIEANNITEKATRGRVGLSALTGEQITRYGTRNIYGTFLGPSADAVADIFQVSGSIFAGDTTQSDLRKARQLLPFQNLFYIRSLLNEVEEGVGDSLNLPDTRR